MFLEQRVSEGKAPFFKRVRDYFSSSLAALLMAGTLALAGCQKSGKCYVDSDCPGNQLCVSGVCLESGECVRDSDCPGEKICENGYCHEPSTPSVDTSTPEGAYRGLVGALRQNDVERALSYFHPNSEIQSDYRVNLSSRDLAELSRQLENGNPAECNSEREIKECYVNINNKRKIIQLMLVEEGGHEVYKIWNF